MAKLRIWGLVWAAAFMLTLQGVAQAAVGPWASNDHGRLRLVSAVQGIGEDGPLLLGLQVQMQPDWKIYWRSPGDAGFPPQLDWSASQNLSKATMEWPAPHRFSLFGLETFGYGKEVVLPLLIEPTNRSDALALEAKVSYLTCSDICVPHEETVQLTLAAGPTGLTPEKFLIEEFQAMVPRDGKAVGLALEEAHLEGDLLAPRLVARFSSQETLVAPDLLVEGPPGFYYGKPKIESRDAGRAITVSVTVDGDGESTIDGKPMTLTLLDGDRGMETAIMARFDPNGMTLSDALAAGKAADGRAGTVEPWDWVQLIAILGAALLGGLILNLMPCVLPVLSLKLLSVIKQSGREKRLIRASFIASAAGILFSFGLLALGAIAFKLAGLNVGWGIQFQQPLFLLFMALLLVLFASNLFGFFEIILPSGLSSRLAAKGGDGLVGSFVTGCFATLLATPCSAPFLGSAVGFALSRGALEIFMVFGALGLGLALPYLLVAAFPGVAQRLPKPGNWMITLRKILGLALLGTALWLLTVLAAQVGLVASLVAALLLILFALFFWRGQARLPRFASVTTALVLALAVFVFPMVLAQEGVGASTAETLDDWAPLDRQVIASKVAAGEVVLVDVTADWCLTCKVNKARVLEDSQVLSAIDQGSVALQRGDWTSPDPAITEYLDSFERYGIPFNAVYGPGSPEGEALPELLTIDGLLEALQRAAGQG